MAEPTLSLAEKLKARFGEKAMRVVEARDETTLEVAAADFAFVAKALRDEEDYSFDCLIDVCGVDYLSYGDDEWETTDVSSEGFSRGVDAEGPGRFTWANRPQGLGPDNRFAAVAHLLSIKHNRRLRLRCFAPDNGLPIVPSLVDVYPVANWFEREAFDLFGIVFEGHEDLRRILTDYGFIGHPFRKDFPLSGHVEMRYDAEQRRVVYEPVSIEPREITPRIIREENYGGLH